MTQEIKVGSMERREAVAMSEAYFSAIDKAYAAGYSMGKADAVRHGTWKAYRVSAERCRFDCTACNGTIGETDQFDETEIAEFASWYRYCPLCGAKMQEEQHGT